MGPLSETCPPAAMKRPVCLIDTGNDGHFFVHQEALQILEQIQQPVVVVAVVGLYRTGKSYLMNRLANKQTGFDLGSTIESKTKGIWMWCVPHPNKIGRTLVLLDTEGLGDTKKGDEQHDMWIFSLAVLLSSTLVYNSMGTVDNTALEKLQFVTELAKHIKVKSSGGSNTEDVFPSFVWTVRDFCLTLEQNGKPITADEYLEDALQLKPGTTAEDEKYNKVRKSLTDFFAIRRCFVMDRPASRDKLKRMEKLKDKDLEPTFLKEVQLFCNYIHDNAQVKTLTRGLTLTGSALGSLAETYVEAIRNGAVPCLENAVESLALIQNTRAVTQALELYQTEMNRKAQLPTDSEQELENIHFVTQGDAISVFEKASFNDKNCEYLEKIKTRLKEEYVNIRMKNINASCEICQSVISEMFQSLENALKDGTYMKSGGYELFNNDLNAATTKYRSVEGKGCKSEEVLSEYLEKKEKEKDMIRFTDHCLTEGHKMINDAITPAVSSNKIVQQLHSELRGMTQAVIEPLEGASHSFENISKLLSSLNVGDALSGNQIMDNFQKELKEMEESNQTASGKYNILNNQIHSLRKERETFMQKREDAASNKAKWIKTFETTQKEEKKLKGSLNIFENDCKEKNDYLKKLRDEEYSANKLTNVGYGLLAVPIFGWISGGIMAGVGASRSNSLEQFIRKATEDARKATEKLSECKTLLRESQNKVSEYKALIENHQSFESEVCEIERKLWGEGKPEALTDVQAIVETAVCALGKLCGSVRELDAQLCILLK